MNDLPLEEQLKRLFAYKAEWLEGKLFDLFTEPAYMPALTTARPCVLIGGRGTGKTTVLQGLSFEGRHALDGHDPTKIRDWTYFGVYYRVATARMNAFFGGGRDIELWEKLFAHYFNLAICRELVRLVLWYERTTGLRVELPASDFETIATSLRLAKCSGWSELSIGIRNGFVSLEATLNDVETATTHGTIAGAPIELLLEMLGGTSDFKNKYFFILLDEYENFKDYQQRIVNALLKHAQRPYTFKIGVRELGWRDRSVMGTTEKLISPADYERVDIAQVFRGDAFRDFALRVANERLSRLCTNSSVPGNGDIQSLLPGLSLDDEAAEFGVRNLADKIIRDLQRHFSEHQLAPLRSMPPLQIYLFQYWAEGQSQALQKLYADYLQDPRKWETRYVNYKFATVFTLRKGRRGINKYYAGWDTFAQLAAGNIRYFLELVEASLLANVRAERTLGPVPPRRQTLAAQDVARTNLEELEGVDIYGAQLTRLVLGLGRIFQVMAKHPSGHTPEVNQFYLAEDLTGSQRPLDEPAIPQELKQLLTSAVMYLALLRWPGTKLLDEASIRQHDYMLHPMFAPFFEYSYRRKRKMQLTPSELLGLVTEPRSTIRDVLARNRRQSDDEIPDQLLLFESFYDEASS